MTLKWHSNVRNLMIGQGLLAGFSNPAAISVYSGAQPRASEVVSNWTNYKTNIAGNTNSFTSDVHTLMQDADWTASSGWRSIAYGAGLFVAVAMNSKSLNTSADGIDWTLRAMPVNAHWISVLYENNTFVAIAYNSSIAATSTDGITWVERVLPVTAEWIDVSFGNGVFVAIASNSNKAATSTDGITWVQRTLPATADWRSIAFGNGIFVAIAYNSVMVATSTDGINWIQRVAPVKLFYKCITFGGNKFVAIAKDTNISITSEDGINWDQVLLPASTLWSEIQYANGSFLAISETSTICAVSSDAFTWVQQALPTGYTLHSLSYGNGVFIALSMATNTSTAIRIVTQGGAETPYLLGHFTGAVWSQPAYGLLLQLAVPPASNGINTGNATWAILWATNITKVQMDASTLPNGEFIVVPVSNDIGPGAIRFADTSFVANVSKVISDGSIDAVMIN